MPDTALIVFDSTVPSGYVQFKVKREERRIARELALEGETK